MPHHRPLSGALHSLSKNEGRRSKTTTPPPRPSRCAAYGQPITASSPAAINAGLHARETETCTLPGVKHPSQAFEVCECIAAGCCRGTRALEALQDCGDPCRTIIIRKFQVFSFRGFRSAAPVRVTDLANEWRGATLTLSVEASFRCTADITLPRLKIL